MSKINNFFANKVCLITGSTSGIGLELGEQILKAGGKVALNSRFSENEQRIQFLKDQYPESLLFVASDVSEFDQCQRMIDDVVSKFQRLDVLIANAGLSATGTLESMNHEVIKRVLETNILGKMYSVKAALPALKKSKGDIMLISSISAFSGIPSYGAYSMSKMTLTSLAQTLRIELNHYGIYVGLAYVGFTQNDEIKRTYDSHGNLIPVESRSTFSVASKSKTASKVLRQIALHKVRSVHSKLGKISWLANRFVPSFVYKKMLTHFAKSMEIENQISKKLPH